MVSSKVSPDDGYIVKGRVRGKPHHREGQLDPGRRGSNSKSITTYSVQSPLMLIKAERKFTLIIFKFARQTIHNSVGASCMHYTLPSVNIGLEERTLIIKGGITEEQNRS